VPDVTPPLTLARLISLMLGGRESFRHLMNVRPRGEAP
jgi:hypothetical protein